MPFSFFDDRVQGGWGDPQVDRPTPGCITAGHRLAAGEWRDTAGGAVTGTSVVRSRTEARRINQRVAPVYIQGGVEAFVNEVTIGRGSNGTTIVSFGPLNHGWQQVGPNLVADALANFGVAAQDADGNQAFFRLTDLNDAVEPYRRKPFTPTGGSSLDPRGVNYTVVLVDISDPNVDWANLQFQNFRAGPDSNQGNDRFLAAVTLGRRELTLHSAQPPTDANQVVGGGYSPHVITGPDGWRLADGEDHREARNIAEVDWGRATNNWTAARYVALRVGAGDYRWWAPMLERVFRTGERAFALPATIRVGLQNIR